MTDNNSTTGKTEEGKTDTSLADVLIALQKSFSRVSAKSKDVPPESARAMIVGNVEFELSIRLEPAEDNLFRKPDGDLQLTLKGVIQQDIRAVPLTTE
jgi:hypothetical protein